jgi:hypothetical protein
MAALMAGIFLTSSVQILRQALSEYRADGAYIQPAGERRYQASIPQDG